MPAIAAATPKPARLRAGFGRLIRSEARRYLARYEATRADPGRAAVHALRTATRRLFSLQLLIAASLPAAGHTELERLLRRPFKAAGKVRDLQVMSRSVGADHREHPELASFLRHLERRLARRRRRLQARLARPYLRRIDRAFSDFAARVAGESSQPMRRDPLAQLLARELARTGQAARAAGQAAWAADPASLHRARLAIKCHRYQAELLRRLHVPFATPLIEPMRRFQAALGAIADCTTLLDSLDAYSRQHPRAARRLAWYRLRVERAQQRQIGLYLPALARRARSSASSLRSWP